MTLSLYAIHCLNAAHGTQKTTPVKSTAAGTDHSSFLRRRRKRVETGDFSDQCLERMASHSGVHLRHNSAAIFGIRGTAQGRDTVSPAVADGGFGQFREPSVVKLSDSLTSDFFAASAKTLRQLR